MYQIFKKYEDYWIFVEEHSSFDDALVRINELRVDGDEYRMEHRNGNFSEVLDA
jgi:hypothetical protein